MVRQAHHERKLADKLVLVVSGTGGAVMREENQDLLERLVRSYFQRGRRIAQDWTPGPAPNLRRILDGPLGRDLQWLESAASGEARAVTESEVAAVRARVLSDLYAPLAGEAPALPDDFENTPLGQALAAAEARASGISAPAQLQAETVTMVRTTDGNIMVTTPVETPGSSEEYVGKRRSQAPPSGGVNAAEWLLGEGTIRGVLYLGGLLVVAAATIFVVYNWGAFPGYLKFGTIFATTLSLYLLGYTLYNTPLQVAGVTFIGIGSIVVPLNFYALYTFVLKPSGIPPDGAWLLGSAFSCGLYIATAWWLRTSLLTYASLVALASLIASAQYILKAPAYVAVPAWPIVTGLLMLLVLEGDKRGFPRYFTQPVRRSSLVANTFLAAALLLASFEETPRSLLWGSILISSVITAAIFGYYGHVSSSPRARIAAYVIVVLAYLNLVFGLSIMLSRLTGGAAVMTLGVVYLGISFTNLFKSYGPTDQWAARAIGYGLALATTFWAADNTQYLTLALLADVAILGGSAYAYRDKDWWAAWGWGAIWLFVLPWLLAFTLIFPATPAGRLSYSGWSPAWSLCLALLCSNYLIIAAIARRWSLSIAAGFTAAALVALPLAALRVAPYSQELPLTTALFAASALAYLAVAVAGRTAWLLYPAPLLLNLTLWTALNAFVKSPGIDSPVTIGSYVALSLVQLYSAWYLEKRGYADWSRPVYAWASVNMGLSFLDALYTAVAAGAKIGFRISPHAGLSPQGVTFIAVSVLYATALFHFSWLQRQNEALTAWLGKATITYIGLAVLAGAVGWAAYDTAAGGHHYAVMGGYLLLGVLLGRSLPQGDLYQVFGKPLQYFGMVAVWAPLSLALLRTGPLEIATAYLVGSAIYWHQAFYRHSRGAGYLAGLLVAVAYAAILQWRGIHEPQAYVIPYGIALLYCGYLEQEGRERYLLDPDELFRAFTWSGLLLLYGTSLAQSLEPDGAPYLALVVVETVAGLLWGLRIRSRGLALLSSGFLAAEAFLQVIDDVMALPAWVLLGGAGVVLLVFGVMALAKRQEIISAGHAVAREWEAWEM
ncbi:MAG: DUF2157 domain-containing protein [Dehalococcoidia bacterium]|nr:DUF2157 domain-containing protein [Dehalococcoidia bacterium]